VSMNGIMNIWEKHLSTLGKFLEIEYGANVLKCSF
jgi:hypothetical protein